VGLIVKLEQASMGRRVVDFEELWIAAKHHCNTALASSSYLYSPCRTHDEIRQRLSGFNRTCRAGVGLNKEQEKLGLCLFAFPRARL